MNIDGHWFEELAEHMGPAYLRYSFTKGTRQEVDFLVSHLGLGPGTRVLDVGCGPGRHAHELARRGHIVHGVDISGPFIELARDTAPPGCTFERLDARRLADRPAPGPGHGFEVVVCLCQGAFGMMTSDGDDLAVLRGMAHHARPGARLVQSAFSAYYSVRYQQEADFDAMSGVCHERTEVKDGSGRVLEASLWTGCYTPRELRLLLPLAGWTVDDVFSVAPGAYCADPPTTESPEFLVVAHLDR